MYRGNMPRDMQVASSQDVTGASWQRTAQLGAFDWKILACPETGGSLIAAPSGVMHALAWTGQDRYRGLHYLTSRDDGRSWSEPVRMGSEDARRSALAAAADGTLAAAWDDTGDDRIHVSISRDGGAKWSSQRTVSDARSRALAPRLVAVSGGFLVFWTEVRPGSTQYEWKSATIGKN